MCWSTYPIAMLVFVKWEFWKPRVGGPPAWLGSFSWWLNLFSVLVRFFFYRPRKKSARAFCVFTVVLKTVNWLHILPNWKQIDFSTNKVSSPSRLYFTIGLFWWLVVMICGFWSLTSSIAQSGVVKKRSREIARGEVAEISLCFALSHMPPSRAVFWDHYRVL